MKLRIIILLCLIQAISLPAFSGKSLVWPNVEYSYAKAYVYNIYGELMSKHNILNDGKLDNSVINEGKLLTENELKELDEIFSSGAAIDVLVDGLSECYFPRHAIVYYDENDQPVAWMSVCFECEGIRFYSPEYPRNHFASDQALVEEAVEKLGEIRLVFAKMGFRTDYGPPTYNPKDRYQKYRLSKRDSIVNTGSMNITNNTAIDSIFKKSLSVNDYDNWVMDTVGVKTKRDSKVTAGGDRITFIDVTKGESSLHFSGRNKDIMLEKAAIFKNDIKPFRSVRIGMTLEDVIGIIGIYDGISNPETILIENDEGTKKIEFHFVKDVLDSYKIEVISW